MNDSIQIKKELRILLWPWIFVVLCGSTRFLAPAVWSVDAAAVFSVGGFALGIPLLASLPFAAEFHFRTLPDLLSLPVGRDRLWRQKNISGGIAVFTAVVPFLWSWHDQPAGVLLVALGWVMLSLCSAALWALETRSLVGAFAGAFLHGTVGTFVIVLFIGMPYWWLPVQWTGVTSALGVAVILVYAAGSYSRGHRKFFRYECRGYEAPTGLPEFQGLQDFHRKAMLRVVGSPGASPLANLIRKELWLLWPLGPMTLFAMVTVLAMALLNRPYCLNCDYGNAAFIRDLVNGLASLVLIGYGALAPIFAGCVPMGMDREAGTHASNLTLPASVRHQWAIRLLTACISVAVGFSLIAACVGLTIVQPTFDQVPELLKIGLLSVLGMWILLIAAFWCAAQSRNSLETGVWFMPVVGLVGMVGAGFWLGQHTFEALPFLDGLLLGLHPLPLPLETYSAFETYYSKPFGFVWAFIPGIPFVLTVVFQSFRSFREEPRLRRAIYRFGVLCLIAVLWGMMVELPVSAGARIEGKWSAVFSDVGHAVRTLNPSLETLRTAGRIDLDRAVLRQQMKSETDKLWLEEATVTVVPSADGRDYGIQARFGGLVCNIERSGTGPRNIYSWHWCVSDSTVP